MAIDPGRVGKAWLIAILLSIAGVPAGSSVAQFDLEMDWNPAVPERDVRESFPPGLTDLFQQALAKPDRDLQRLTIDSIALAYRRGVPDIDRTIPRLANLIAVPNQDRLVMAAAIRALVRMDCKQYAEQLGEIAMSQEMAFANIIEPALAKWQSPVLEAFWIARVKERSSDRIRMTLAMDGLAALGSRQAVEPLKAILLDNQENLRVRADAAHALGQLNPAEVVELGEQIINDKSIPPRIRGLLCVRVLNRTDQPRAIEILKRFAQGDEDSIAAISLQELYELDPQHVYEMAAGLIDSEDSSVRSWSARALVNRQVPESMPLLSTLLDDVNPNLRHEVARALVDLAENEMLKDIICENTLKMLKLDSWRACEMAAFVIGKLDFKPAGPRLVELLGHPHRRVQVASAWALTRLAIKELLPDMHEFAMDQFQRYQASEGNRYNELQMAHLFMAFGKQQYRPAKELMLKYVPKNFMLGLTARPAAVWGLGMMYRNKPDEELTAMLVDRIQDTALPSAEANEVRQMSAVSLGRTKAESSLETLRQFASVHSMVGWQCHWAIEQITGKKAPSQKTAFVENIDWPLVPLPRNDE